MKTPHTAQRFAKTYAQFMPPAFKTCIVLMVLAVMILAGIPLIALVLAGIGILLGQREPDTNESRAGALPAPDKPAPATNNPSLHKVKIGKTNYYINTELMDLFINRAEVVANIDTVESVS